MTRAKTNELKKALHAYLAAVEVEPAELSALENPVDVLVEALALGSASEHGFALLDLSESPYMGLATGDPSAPWRMQWAIQVAELEAFTCPAMEDTLFMVDTVADPQGCHRVYTAEDGLRGDLEFDDIPAALNWMAARVKASISGRKASVSAATKKYAKLLDDDWEDDPRSGWNVFERLLDSGFAEAWDALSRGEWPVLDDELEEPPSEAHAATARAQMAYVTERFVRERQVELPEGLAEGALTAVHHALLEQLRELEQALHRGKAPSAIAEARRHSDELLAELASAWQSRFDDVRRTLESPRKGAAAESASRRTSKSEPSRAPRMASADAAKLGVSVRKRAPAPGSDPLPALSDLGGLGGLGGLADLGDLDDLDLLTELEGLGDIESDAEFAALERELGRSSATADSTPPPRMPAKAETAPKPTKAAKTTKTTKAAQPAQAAAPAKRGKADGRGGDDDDLGGLGGALRALLGGGAGPGAAADDDDEPEDVELTPFNQKLMAALDVLLDQMEAEEVIEIIPDRKQMLVREMVRAASDARSPKHMLSSLTRALVDSEQLEEIYATDDQIQRLLRGALGG